MKQWDLHLEVIDFRLASRITVHKDLQIGGVGESLVVDRCGCHYDPSFLLCSMQSSYISGGLSWRIFHLVSEKPLHNSNFYYIRVCSSCRLLASVLLSDFEIKKGFNLVKSSCDSVWFSVPNQVWLGYM